MKKINITILISLLILLTACTYLESIQLPKFGREDLPEKEEFQKGTEGLSIRFVQEATPQKVREGSIFDAVFELQNKGYSDINEGLFKLITEEQYIKTEKNRGTMMLKGKNQYLTKGEAKRITFHSKAGQIDETLTEFPVKMTMVACYVYEMAATEIVCIDPDFEGIKKDKACKAEEMTISGGQGSPVTVTKIIPHMTMGETGPKPAFEIYIENKGEGQVISPQYIEHACGAKSSERIKEYDQVEIEAELSNQILKCHPSKITIKKGRELKILCEQETPITRRAEYTAPLQIRIRYGYLTSTHGDITITKRSIT